VKELEVTYAGIQDHVLGSEEEGRAVRVGRVRDLIDEQSVVGPVKGRRVNNGKSCRGRLTRWM
jgi:hypothetical protein